jgi:hypothetical protein
MVADAWKLVEVKRGNVTAMAMVQLDIVSEKRVAVVV